MDKPPGGSGALRRWSRGSSRDAGKERRGARVGFGGEDQHELSPRSPASDVESSGLRRASIASSSGGSFSDTESAFGGSFWGGALSDGFMAFQDDATVGLDVGIQERMKTLDALHTPPKPGWGVLRDRLRDGWPVSEHGTDDDDSDHSEPRDVTGADATPQEPKSPRASVQTVLPSLVGRADDRAFVSDQLSPLLGLVHGSKEDAEWAAVNGGISLAAQLIRTYSSHDPLQQQAARFAELLVHRQRNALPRAADRLPGLEQLLEAVHSALKEMLSSGSEDAFTLRCLIHTLSLLTLCPELTPQICDQEDPKYPPLVEVAKQRKLDNTLQYAVQGLGHLWLHCLGDDETRLPLAEEIVPVIAHCMQLIAEDQQWVPSGPLRSPVSEKLDRHGTELSLLPPMPRLGSGLGIAGLGLRRRLSGEGTRIDVVQLADTVVFMANTMLSAEAEVERMLLCTPEAMRACGECMAALASNSRGREAVSQLMGCLLALLKSTGRDQICPVLNESAVPTAVQTTLNRVRDDSALTKTCIDVTLELAHNPLFHPIMYDDVVWESLGAAMQTHATDTAIQQMGCLALKHLSIYKLETLIGGGCVAIAVAAMLRLPDSVDVQRAALACLQKFACDCGEGWRILLSPGVAGSSEEPRIPPPAVLQTLTKRELAGIAQDLGITDEEDDGINSRRGYVDWISSRIAAAVSETAVAAAVAAAAVCMDVPTPAPAEAAVTVEEEAAEAAAASAPAGGAAGASPLRGDAAIANSPVRDTAAATPAVEVASLRPPLAPPAPTPRTDSLGSGDGVSAILSVLQRHYGATTQDMIRVAAGAVQQLSQTDSGRRALLDQEAIPTLVKILSDSLHRSSEAAVVRLHIIASLAQLTRRQRTAAMQFKKAAGMLAVLETLELCTEPRQVADCSRLLAQLLRHDCLRRDFVDVRGDSVVMLISTVLPKFAVGDPMSQWSLCAIANLAELGELRPSLLQLDAVEIFVEPLARCAGTATAQGPPPWAGLQQTCGWGLANFLVPEFPEVRAKLEENEAVIAALEAASEGRQVLERGQRTACAEALEFLTERKKKEEEARKAEEEHRKALSKELEDRRVKIVEEESLMVSRRTALEQDAIKRKSMLDSSFLELQELREQIEEEKAEMEALAGGFLQDFTFGESDDAVDRPRLGVIRRSFRGLSIIDADNTRRPHHGLSVGDPAEGAPLTPSYGPRMMSGIMHPRRKSAARSASPSSPRMGARAASMRVRKPSMRASPSPRASDEGAEVQLEATIMQRPEGLSLSLGGVSGVGMSRSASRSMIRTGSKRVLKELERERAARVRAEGMLRAVREAAPAVVDAVLGSVGKSRRRSLPAPLPASLPTTPLGAASDSRRSTALSLGALGQQPTLPQILEAPPTPPEKQRRSRLSIGTTIMTDILPDWAVKHGVDAATHEFLDEHGGLFEVTAAVMADGSISKQQRKCVLRAQAEVRQQLSSVPLWVDALQLGTDVLQRLWALDPNGVFDTISEGDMLAAGITPTTRGRLVAEMSWQRLLRQGEPPPLPPAAELLQELEWERAAHELAERARSSAGECYPLHTRVELHSLQRLSELNGVCGTVVDLRVMQHGAVCMLVETAAAGTHLVLPRNAKLPAPAPPSPDAIPIQPLPTGGVILAVPGTEAESQTPEEWLEPPPPVPPQTESAASQAAPDVADGGAQTSGSAVLSDADVAELQRLRTTAAATRHALSSRDSAAGDLRIELARLTSALATRDTEVAALKQQLAAATDWRRAAEDSALAAKRRGDASECALRSQLDDAEARCAGLRLQVATLRRTEEDGVAARVQRDASLMEQRRIEDELRTRAERAEGILRTLPVRLEDEDAADVAADVLQLADALRLSERKVAELSTSLRAAEEAAAMAVDTIPAAEGTDRPAAADDEERRIEPKEALAELRAMEAALKKAERTIADAEGRVKRAEQRAAAEEKAADEGRAAQRRLAQLQEVRDDDEAQRQVAAQARHKRQGSCRLEDRMEQLERVTTKEQLRSATWAREAEFLKQKLGAERKQKEALEAKLGYANEKLAWLEIRLQRMDREFQREKKAHSGAERRSQHEVTLAKETCAAERAARIRGDERAEAECRAARRVRASLEELCRSVADAERRRQLEREEERRVTVACEMAQRQMRKDLAAAKQDLAQANIQVSALEAAGGVQRLPRHGEPPRRSARPSAPAQHPPPQQPVVAAPLQLTQGEAGAKEGGEGDEAADAGRPEEEAGGEREAAERRRSWNLAAAAESLPGYAREKDVHLKHFLRQAKQKQSRAAFQRLRKARADAQAMKRVQADRERARVLDWAGMKDAYEPPARLVARKRRTSGASSHEDAAAVH